MRESGYRGRDLGKRDRVGGGEIEGGPAGSGVGGGGYNNN